MGRSTHENANIKDIRNAKGQIIAHLIRVQVGPEDWQHSSRRVVVGELTLPQMRTWRDRERERLEGLSPDTQRRAGTLRAAAADYVKQAAMTPETRVRREQQLAWWLAQSAKRGSAVLSVEDVTAEQEALKAGTPRPQRGVLLGDIAPSVLDLDRVREILSKAFKASDESEDPTEFANTSNHYRTAMRHMFKYLQRNDNAAENPIDKVETRSKPGAQEKGYDMRLIAEVLKHLQAPCGRDGTVTRLRLTCLAWTNIEPKQLKGFKPLRDLHDVPGASPAALMNGVVTATFPGRKKGRRKVQPKPELKFLVPQAVEAYRALRDAPAAHGPFSTSSALKALRRAARAAQQHLASKGLDVDLSGITVKQLRHSFLSAMRLATHGRVGADGQIAMHQGIVKSAGHADPRMTRVYTERVEQETQRLAIVDTAYYLHDLLTNQPLVPAAASRTSLRRVK